MGYGLGGDIGGLGSQLGAPVGDTSAPAMQAPYSPPPAAPQAQIPSPQVGSPQGLTPPPGGYMAADSQGNPVPVDSSGQAVMPGSNLPTSNVPMPPPRPTDLGVGAPMQLASAYNPNAPSNPPTGNSPGLPFMGANGFNLQKMFNGAGKIATGLGGGTTLGAAGGAGSGAKSFAQSGAADAVKAPQVAQNSAAGTPLTTAQVPFLALLTNMLLGKNAPIFTGQVGQKPPGTSGNIF